MDSVKPVIMDDYEKTLLKAKLALRNHFYTIFVRIVHDDVGQVLSLVRMQVAFYNQQKEENDQLRLMQASEWIARCIKDLRTACRLLKPEEQLSGYQELLELIQFAISPVNPDCRIELDANQLYNTMGKSDQSVLLLYYIVTVCTELTNMEIKTDLIRVTCQEEHSEITLACFKPERKIPLVTGQTIHEKLAPVIMNLGGQFQIIEHAENTAIIINFSHSNQL